MRSFFNQHYVKTLPIAQCVQLVMDVHIFTYEKASSLVAILTEKRPIRLSATYLDVFTLFSGCFFLTVDQETIARIGPHGRKQGGEGLPDDVAEGRHAALGKECNDGVADERGSADRKEHH